MSAQSDLFLEDCCRAGGWEALLPAKLRPWPNNAPKPLRAALAARDNTETDFFPAPSAIGLGGGAALPPPGFAARDGGRAKGGGDPAPPPEWEGGGLLAAVLASLLPHPRRNPGVSLSPQVPSSSSDSQRSATATISSGPQRKGITITDPARISSRSLPKGIPLSWRRRCCGTSYSRHRVLNRSSGRSSCR